MTISATIPAGGGASAPEGGAARAPRTAAPPPPTKRLSVDDFVDGALANMSADEQLAPAAAPKKPKPPREEPPEEEEEELPDEAATAAEEGEEEPEEDEEEGKDAAPARGTKENPFKIRDLPKNAFIEIKVDGEKQIIKVEDLPTGYIAERTFKSRMTRLSQLAQGYEQVVSEARQVPERVRASFGKLLANPEQLYSFLISDPAREKTLQAIAVMRAQDIQRWEQDPSARARFIEERAQATMEAREQALSAQQETQRRSQEQQAMVEQRKKELRPGWEAGLKEAGFPTVDRELLNMVGALMARHNETMREPVTSDDVRKFVVRAAKALERQPASAKKPLPGIVLGKQRRLTAGGNGSNGGKDYSKMSYHQKMRDDDFFLQGKKLRG